MDEELNCQNCGEEDDLVCANTSQDPKDCKCGKHDIFCESCYEEEDRCVLCDELPDDCECEDEDDDLADEGDLDDDED